MTDSSSKSRRPRMKWTAAENSEWLALFRNSGLSASRLCRENDLSAATLALWLRPPPQESEETALVEVPHEVVAELTSTSTVTLQLPGGARLEIVQGTDPGWLAQLVRAFAPAEI